MGEPELGFDGLAASYTQTTEERVTISLNNRQGRYVTVKTYGAHSKLRIDSVEFFGLEDYKPAAAAAAVAAAAASVVAAVVAAAAAAAVVAAERAGAAASAAVAAAVAAAAAAAVAAAVAAGGLGVDAESCDAACRHDMPADQPCEFWSNTFNCDEMEEYCPEREREQLRIVLPPVAGAAAAAAAAGARRGGGERGD